MISKERFQEIVKKINNQTEIGSNYYILLDDHTVYKAKNNREGIAILKITEYEKDYSRKLARFELDEYWISTIFLTLDHAMPGEDPILFETMAFKDSFNDDDRESDLFFARYHTYEEAMKGHQVAIEWLTNLSKGDALSLTSPDLIDRKIAENFARKKKAKNHLKIQE